MATVETDDDRKKIVRELEESRPAHGGAFTAAAERVRDAITAMGDAHGAALEKANRRGDEYRDLYFVADDARIEFRAALVQSNDSHARLISAMEDLADGVPAATIASRMAMFGATGREIDAFSRISKISKI